MGAVDILELNTTEERFNVNTKSLSDIFNSPGKKLN